MIKRRTKNTFQIFCNNKYEELLKCAIKFQLHVWRKRNSFDKIHMYSESLSTKSPEGIAYGADTFIKHKEHYAYLHLNESTYAKEYFKIPKKLNKDFSVDLCLFHEIDAFNSVPKFMAYKFTKKYKKSLYKGITGYLSKKDFIDICKGGESQIKIVMYTCVNNSTCIKF